MATTPIKVLLVEDDLMLCDMYQMKFTSEGFDVWKGNNGIEGLKLLNEKGVPDIILLDVIMPQMDGFTMLGKVKENTAWKDVPVILLTNLGQENDVKRGIAMGANDYLVKANFTPAQVVEKVKALLTSIKS
ncbi:MAG: response regulator [bacterium]|nr:response regulator [bacterium]